MWNKLCRVIIGGLGVILVMAIVYVFYLSGSLSSIPTKISDGYTLGDEEVNYMISMVVNRGGGWYKDFSIVYPPGRYIALSFLYTVIPATFPSYHLYWRIWALAAPVAFFYLCHNLYCALGAKKLVATTCSALATGVYLSFVHSMQEAQVVLLLLGITLFLKNSRWKPYILGFLLALVFLFRIDLGIMAIIAFIIAYWQAQTKPKFRELVAGSLVIWVPVIIIIALNGSLGNFFHDTVLLGLFNQPRQMSLPIPNNSFWLVYWSTLVMLVTVGGEMIARARGKGELGIKVIAGVMILMYLAALGRSDEPHLWYGLAFWPVVVGYYLMRVRELRVTPSSIGITAIVVGWSYIILQLKSPTIFLITSTGFLIAMGKVRIEKLGSLALVGLAASLMIFHSVSFIKLRFTPPHGLLPEVVEEGTFLDDPGEVAGLKLGEKTELMLAEVREVVKEDSILIYPDHTLYYEYLGKANPSRYYFMIGESTNRTETELLTAVRDVRYVLLFPTSARSVGSEVEKCILQETREIKKYVLDGMEVSLRKNAKQESGAVW